MIYKRLIMVPVLVLILIPGDYSMGAVSLESLLPKDLPEGWGLMNRPRTFTKKTLFEHIDGQAELFFKYGFEKSIFTIYQHVKRPHVQIELDLYEMGNVLQAFGIFSRLRTEGRPAGIGLESHLDDQSLLFYKGRYFVMLYATESTPSVLRQLSTSISSKISDASPPPKETGYFPGEGLKPGSLQYFHEGLLGHQFLRRGFLAAYQHQVEVKAEDAAGGKAKELYLFLVIFKDGNDAKRGLDSYRDYLLKKGKVVRSLSTRLEGEDPYRGRLIAVSRGGYLLGVVGFETEEEGKHLLEEFLKNVK